ncbi:MAG: PaaI family thioesterase [Rhizobiaceae bacterium]|nr:PaaI family thioesterase [Rhizobiaceae bacterium]
MDETAARQAFEQALETHEPAFGTFFLARLLELEISYSDEACSIAFPVRDFLFNPQGSLHGGVIATVMDISMGHLLKHAFGAGGATLEMKLQYLRPVLPPSATCQGCLLRRGRNISFMESRVWDAEGRLAVHATATWRPAQPAAAG